MLAIGVEAEYRSVTRSLSALGGIDRFLIATLDHVDSLGFVVRISLRANPEDRVVIDEVSICRSWLPNRRLKRGR
jgi:hypothetical protein